MYRRPAVTVIQEFLNLVPALAQFSLPTVAIGPAYQLVTADNLGTYTGTSHDYAYASLNAGNVVDTTPLDPKDPFPATKLPIAVTLKNVMVQIVASSSSGAGSDVNFTDSSANFTSVAVGDYVVIGSTKYKVRAVVSTTALTLESPLSGTAPFTYTVQRSIADFKLALTTQFTVSSTAVSLLSNLTDANSHSVVSATVYADYRALRTDLAATVKEYTKLTDVQTAFGATQITPANPLAYGLFAMLQNTVTSVNGLGLDSNAVTAEDQSYLNAAEILSMTDMYALVPLTQNPVVHQDFKTHVDGMSGKQKERVVLINRLIKTEQTMQAEQTTDATVTGRTIVSTQTTGAVSGAGHTILGSSSLFANVQPGDVIVVTGGTGAVVGNHTVASVQSSSSLTSATALASGTATDLDYYILRQDGIDSTGTVLYDRNSTFISDGVAVGDIVRVATINGSAAKAGDYKVTTVNSEKQLTIAQVQGVTTVQTAVDYTVVRTMTKAAQASFIAGYSASFADRRVVNVWPDSLLAPVGAQTQKVPGFYGCCALGAMTAGLPTQQGFTNLTLAGFLGFDHSTGYFDDDQLDTIAGGGTLVLAQAGDSTPLYVRHQLTTDTSAIKFQEFSVTKNVDFLSKFLRRVYAPFIGVYNIVDTTMDELRGTATASIKFLREDTRLPRIGGVIRNGRLTALAQDDTQVDTVRMTFVFDIPIPLNQLAITIFV